VYLRAGDPGVLAAWQALFGGLPATARAKKQSAMRDKGDEYPAWVLNEMGVDVMLANRVAMGRGIQPPRFLWVPFADALMFPLNNTRLAEKNSDRKAFFADEEMLLRRYLKDAGLAAPPSSLRESLSRLVTLT